MRCTRTPLGAGTKTCPVSLEISCAEDGADQATSTVASKTQTLCMAASPLRPRAVPYRTGLT